MLFNYALLMYRVHLYSFSLTFVSIIIVLWHIIILVALRCAALHSNGSQPMPLCSHHTAISAIRWILHLCTTCCDVYSPLYAIKNSRYAATIKWRKKYERENGMISGALIQSVVSPWRKLKRKFRGCLDFDALKIRWNGAFLSISIRNFILQHKHATLKIATCCGNNHRPIVLMYSGNGSQMHDALLAPQEWMRLSRGGFRCYQINECLVK